MGYELKREDIYAFASSIGAETHQKGSELWFTECPYCHGKGDNKDTFSINLETGCFNCFRASCGEHGHFVELCRDFDFKLEYNKPAVYRQLPQPKGHIGTKPEAIKYLESRGISDQIAELFEITVRNDNPSVLVFPFRDEQNRLQFIKYRNTKYKRGDRGSKEWCEKDTMPILFGMAQCVDFSRLVITEGQLDSLSLSQAGILNAVSVPTGAQGFTWLAPCWDWICKFKEVVVFGDWEHGKMSLLEYLKSRLPMTVKAVRQQDYLGEKDANDILRKYGCNALVKAVENAEVPIINNVKDLSSVESVDLNNLIAIRTGVDEIDRTTGGIMMGQVALLTGQRGEGKSTFGSQIIANVLDQRDINGQPFNVFAYSGELADYHFKRWLDLQIAGRKNIESCENNFGDTVYNIPKNVQDAINSWYKGRIYVYDNEYIAGDDEHDVLVSTIEKVVKEYGVRFVFIDNLMTAMDSVSSRDNVYQAQGNFVTQLKKLATKYDIAILLVAHPRKQNGGIFTNDDVSGSSDITNRVDIVMSYQRAQGEAIENGAQSQLVITKNRLKGKLRVGNDAIPLIYDEACKRICSPREYEPRHYGWENIIQSSNQSSSSSKFAEAYTPRIKAEQTVKNWETAPEEDVPF